MRLLEIEAPRIEQGTTRGNCYDRYQELGGIINEEAYFKALVEAGQILHLGPSRQAQAKIIAGAAGIPTNDPEGRFGKIVILYEVLRTEPNPGKQYHHSQMGDQRLFAEATRMLDYPDLLDKITQAHPNISF